MPYQRLDRGVEQPRHEAAADRAEHDRPGQGQPARARVEDHAGVRPVVVEVERDEREPAADHGTWHDPEGDEQQVVAAEMDSRPRRIVRVRREPHPTGERGGDQEGDEDRDRDPDRLPSDVPVADVGQGVELERDDGQRHGGSVAVAAGAGSLGPAGVGWPTPALSTRWCLGLGDGPIVSDSDAG